MTYDWGWKDVELHATITPWHLWCHGDEGKHGIEMVNSRDLDPHDPFHFCGFVTSGRISYFVFAALLFCYSLFTINYGLCVLICDTDPSLV